VKPDVAKTCTGRFSITSPSPSMPIMFCKRRPCFLNLKREPETRNLRVSIRFPYPGTH
jgi:hypothetical protein